MTLALTLTQVQKNPERLRSEKGSTGFDPELLSVSLTDSVLKRIHDSQSNTTQLWSNKCTVNRLSDPISNFRDFLIVNGSQPAIFTPQSGVMPATITSFSAEDVAPPAQGSELVSCLCNPRMGTNFHDVKDEQKKEQYRYCLWQYGFVAPFVLKGKGSMSNRHLADRLKFQCRLSQPRDIAHMVNSVLKQLLESGSPQTSSFWHSTPVFWHSTPVFWHSTPVQDTSSFWHSTPVQDTAVMWISSPDTRTPLHRDEFEQFLIQLQGTKHVTVSSDPGLVEQAWAHGGPFNQSLYKPSRAPDQAGDQECLLRPGEMLWLPFGKLHDVYSLEPSVSITLRYVSDQKS